MVQVKKFFGRGAGDDEADFEQDNARGEKQCFAQIVRDENDGLAEAADKSAEFALKLGAGDGIERAEGLVHEQNGGISCESAGHADALTLASGEFARAAMREFARIEADKMEHFIDTLGSASGIPAFEGRDESDVFRNREMGEEAGILNDVTDATAETDRVPRGGRPFLNKDFSFRGQ